MSTAKPVAYLSAHSQYAERVEMLAQFTDRLTSNLIRYESVIHTLLCRDQFEQVDIVIDNMTDKLDEAGYTVTWDNDGIFIYLTADLSHEFEDAFMELLNAGE